MSLLTVTRDYGRMIKFSHTIFALPFALSAATLAFQSYSFSWMQLMWIVLSMIGARSAAMGFNRIVDAKWDAKNPRTAQREIPRGAISALQAWVFVGLSSALLVFSAFELNTLCFVLSPVVLAIVFFYSLTKRFTSLAHIFLGIALGVAPLGAWLAIAGTWNSSILFMSFGVLTWVAGFDIIYACQDFEFDSRENLFSIPRTLGISNALWISRGLHVLCILSLVAGGWLWNMGSFYYVGITVIAALLYYEQNLVRADDFSKVNMAFFNMNGIISLIYFLTVLLDVVV